MKLTKIGSDYVKIDENNIDDEKLKSIKKIHLIKLDFFSPSREKIQMIMENFSETNRFVIANKIKIYNDILKTTKKKYYCENSVDDRLVSFFKRNNKVLLNFFNLNPIEKQFALSDIAFEDIIRNTEVIVIDKESFGSKEETLKRWRGNVIIATEKQIENGEI